MKLVHLHIPTHTGARLHTTTYNCVSLAYNSVQLYIITYNCISLRIIAYNRVQPRTITYNCVQLYTQRTTVYDFAILLQCQPLEGLRACQISLKSDYSRSRKGNDIFFRLQHIK